jgi:hypothetical protein
VDIIPPVYGPRQPFITTHILKTNFYPRYGAANDQVDPVLAVHPVYFQRVIPRYRLSTSETRDLGVGPMFDASVIGVHPYPMKPTRYWEPLPSWKGQHIDLLA